VDLLVAVQVDEPQVTFFVRSPFRPWLAMMNVEFLSVEESDATLRADVFLSLGEPSLAGGDVFGFRLLSPLPVLS
jgi:hypothetical protein